VSTVVALVPDLMFGSKVMALLEQAGHDVHIAPDIETAREKAADADVVIADLASGDVDPFEAIEAAKTGGDVKTLAVYSHVEAESRRRAEEAGFDLVVPRSRMVREGAELVARLLGG
jgi:CheY-like chemotaxis protein